MINYFRKFFSKEKKRIGYTAWALRVAVLPGPFHILLIFYRTMSKMGFQATSLGNGIEEIRRMIECKINPPESDRKM